MKTRPLAFSSAALALLALAALVGRAWQSKPSPYTYSAPPALGDGWKTGAADRIGVDKRHLERMTDFVREHPELNVHAVLIEREGQLVYEEYFSGRDERWGQPLGVVTFTRDTKHDLRSVTKSVVSALVGVANDTGAIRSLDAPLVDYFPELKDLQTDERKQMTIRHALEMRAGLEWNEQVPYTDPKNDEIVMNRSSEPMRYVLSRPIVATPGTVWNYNGGATQVLGTIVQRATKKPLADYAREVLWSRMGITDIEWVGTLDGVPSAASGLRLRPRDLAKFGSLYLHEGRWNDRQVIPATWAAESTRRHVTFPARPQRGYGYQWWHTCYDTSSGVLEVPTGVGNGAQRVFLMRAHGAVVTVLCGRYNDFSSNPPERLLLDYIVPALGAAPAASCP
jgi:CubicO group peptidase (beta-lactamase class C family)